MHCTYRQTLGTEIIEEQNHETVGIVVDMLIDPDRGTIPAVLAHTVLEADLQILLTHDILSWGKRIHVRSLDVLGPVAENIRMQHMLRKERPLIGQRIITKSGIPIGKCTDVQFDANKLTIEWLFPRRFFRRKIAIPASDILEITTKAIIVRDQMPKEEQPVKEKTAQEPAALAPIPSPTHGMGRNSMSE